MRSLPLGLLFSSMLYAQEIRFERTASNLSFVLENSPTAQKHMVETMPGGIAVLDYNQDGKPDLFFTNGATLPGLDKTAPRYWNRLFRNEGNWKFTDVTAETGVSGVGYSMGVTVGDFDNDGFPDLFVAGLYRNQLLRNLGNGKFADVTAGSGILSNEWGVTGGWFDFDNDGKLDLLVVNYGKIDLKNPRFCGDTARQVRVYCHPKYYEPRPNQLYRNLGNGKFEDVTQSSGLGKHLGRGMSVAFGDADGDGRIDAFLTNDGLANFLFRNAGGGKFEETALLAGVALLDHGKAIASMGTEFQDYDNDGRPDLIVTALNGETFPVFHNEGNGMFSDRTARSGLAQLTNRYAGWGVGLVDLDNDGAKDIFTANSHVNDIAEQFEATTYKQANAVFRNAGAGKFMAVAASGLEKTLAAHRGAVFADFDGDGRLDAVVSVLGTEPELWRNVSPGAQQWVGLQLVGSASNRDAIGAVVTVNGQVQTVTSSTSYASSVAGPIHFGLGAATKANVTVRWPSGRTSSATGLEAGRIHKLTEPALSAAR